MKGRAVIIFIYSMAVLGCAKTITLAEFANKKGPVILLHLQEADLYFSKEEILSMANAQMEKESDHTKEILKNAHDKLKNAQLDTLSLTLKLNESASEETASAHALVYLLLPDLLRKGRVKVFNKSTSRFAEKIICKRVKSPLGNITDVFAFKGGKEFYNDVIALGE